MNARRRQMSRKAVEDAYGRNCVAALPSGRPAERLTTPWGTEILVLSDPDPRGLRRLVARDGYASIRFWLSPCGDHAVAWTAGDVAHFQLYCELADRGWHQGRIDLGREGGPVLSVQDPVVDILMDGKAAARMTDGPYAVHTSLRTIHSHAVPEEEPAPAPTP